MPRHEDMDYEHWRGHCDDCWDEYIQEKRHREMVEALERWGGVTDDMPKTRVKEQRTFVIPKKEQSKGGIENIEPI